MALRKTLLGVTLALAVAPEAGADAVCTIDVQGSQGTARCLGSIGKWTVDPSPVPAQLGAGRFSFEPRRLMSLDPDPTMTFSGRWSAVGPLISGHGVIEGETVPFVGDLRRAAGGVQIELALGSPQKQTQSGRAGARARAKRTGEA